MNKKNLLIGGAIAAAVVAAGGAFYYYETHTFTPGKRVSFDFLSTAKDLTTCSDAGKQMRLEGVIDKVETDGKISVVWDTFYAMDITATLCPNSAKDEIKNWWSKTAKLKWKLSDNATNAWWINVYLGHSGVAPVNPAWSPNVPATFTKDNLKGVFKLF